MNNTELLQKQMQDLQKANDVTLPPDEGRAFMRDVVGSAATLRKLYFYDAKSPVGKIEALGVKKRQMRLHQGLDTEPTGTDHVVERGVPFALVPVMTDAWFKNDNVYYTARMRGQNVEDVVAGMIQEQFAADMQDLAFNGDEASADPFLEMNDGFLKQARTNADTIKHDVAADITVADLQAVPTKVAREQLRAGKFVWIMGAGTHAALQAEVIARPTPKGDAVLIDGELRKLHGYDIELVDHIEDDKVLFTPLENLTVVTGFDVSYQRTGAGDRAVAKQGTYHFVLSSADFVIRTPKALVYIAQDAVTP